MPRSALVVFAVFAVLLVSFADAQDPVESITLDAAEQNSTANSSSTTTAPETTVNTTTVPTTTTGTTVTNGTTNTTEATTTSAEPTTVTAVVNITGTTASIFSNSTQPGNGTMSSTTPNAIIEYITQFNVASFFLGFFICAAITLSSLLVIHCVKKRRARRYEQF